MRRRIWPVFVALLCVPLLGAEGCGGASSGEANRQDGAPKLPNAPQAGGKAADGKPDGQKDELISRKIIYTAVVEVVVKDVEQAAAEVNRIVEEIKGYVAKSDITGQVGSRRTATWTLKVPVDKFPEVLRALTALGQVVKNASDSQDVTEEYVDLQSRIKNLKVEEETLNKFLKEAITNVDGYLKTRDQIKNVRGEIERAEGRLKYLATMTSLSSITFTAREEQTYDPVRPAAAPTFGDDLDGTFTQSWKSLLRLGKNAVLFVVGLAPWLPLIAVGFFVGRFALRRVSEYSGFKERPIRPMARATRKMETPDEPAKG